MARTALRNYFQGFLYEQPLSAVGNKFVIFFDKIGEQMVGVAKRNTPTTRGLCKHAGAWMLDISLGTTYAFFNSGQHIPLGTKQKFNCCSRLAVSVSPTGLLSFELEGTLLHMFQLPDAEDIYAALDIMEPGQTENFV